MHVCHYLFNVGKEVLALYMTPSPSFCTTNNPHSIAETDQSSSIASKSNYADKLCPSQVTGGMLSDSETEKKNSAADLDVIHLVQRYNRSFTLLTSEAQPLSSLSP